MFSIRLAEDRRKQPRPRGRAWSPAQRERELQRTDPGLLIFGGMLMFVIVVAAVGFSGRI